MPAGKAVPVISRKHSERQVLTVGSMSTLWQVYMRIAERSEGMWAEH